MRKETLKTNIKELKKVIKALEGFKEDTDTNLIIKNPEDTKWVFNNREEK